jgi:hypothetical protein
MKHRVLEAYVLSFLYPVYEMTLAEVGCVEFLQLPGTKEPCAGTFSHHCSKQQFDQAKRYCPK